MIEAKGIARSFGALWALRDIDFSIGRGELVSILGPNGAGKTTLMRVLTGFLAPTKGKITMGGLDQERHLRLIQRKLGYLPETAPLYKEMTVREQVTFSGRMRGLGFGRLKRAVDEALERCQIGMVSNRLIGVLSKGYRQRVGLASTLVGSPELLILDEPTSGLDPEQIVSMRELIRALAGQRTILLSTHILPEAEQLSDRVLILSRGRLVASEQMSALKAAGKHKEEVHVRIAGPVEEVTLSLGTIAGVEEVRLLANIEGASALYSVIFERGLPVVEQVTERLVARRFKLLELTPARPNLEEVYLNLVREKAREKLEPANISGA